MTFIYSLKCPQTGQVKYIGKADRPNRRLKSHLRDALSGANKHRTAQWIAALLDAGSLPVLEVLFEVPANESWQAAEKRTIAAYIAAGADLTNSTAGGQGLSLLHESDRRAVSSALSAAWKRSRESRVAALRRGNARPEARANRIAAANEPETVAKRAAAHRRGLYENSEVMARRRASQIAASNRADVKAAKAAASRDRWMDPAFRARMREKQQAAWIVRKQRTEA